VSTRNPFDDDDSRAPQPNRLDPHPRHFNVPPDLARMLSESSKRDRDGSWSRFKACGARELEKLTGEGWTLIFVRAEQRLISECWHSDGSRCNGSSGTAMCEQLVFVLARRRDDELEGVRRELEQVREEEARANGAVIHADRRIAEAEIARDEALEHTKNLTIDAEAAKHDAETRNRNLRRLEEDLAKVRSEIGDREWKRIVGGASP
jgi:hypothetical protein